jgi:N-acetyl-1-D-myo-inositol-2-amino-2-deoxy-alpha-D-glucopyranoside deacetylase
MAHLSEVERGALPGRLAGLPPTDRERLLSTEWYIHHDLASTAAAHTGLAF